jgi:hypothetical protein
MKRYTNSLWAALLALALAACSSGGPAGASDRTLGQGSGDENHLDVTLGDTDPD